MAGLPDQGGGKGVQDATARHQGAATQAPPPGQEASAGPEQTPRADAAAVPTAAPDSQYVSHCPPQYRTDAPDVALQASMGVGQGVSAEWDRAHAPPGMAAHCASVRQGVGGGGAGEAAAPPTAGAGAAGRAGGRGGASQGATGSPARRTVMPPVVPGYVPPGPPVTEHRSRPARQEAGQARPPRTAGWGLSAHSAAGRAARAGSAATATRTASQAGSHQAPAREDATSTPQAGAAARAHRARAASASPGGPTPPGGSAAAATGASSAAARATHASHAPHSGTQPSVAAHSGLASPPSVRAPQVPVAPSAAQAAVRAVATQAREARSKLQAPGLPSGRGTAAQPSSATSRAPGGKRAPGAREWGAQATLLGPRATASG